MKEKIEKIINRIKNLFKNNKKPYFPKDASYGENPDVNILEDNTEKLNEKKDIFIMGYNPEEIRDENGQLIEKRVFFKDRCIIHKYSEGIKVKTETIRYANENLKDDIVFDENGQLIEKRFFYKDYYISHKYKDGVEVKTETIRYENDNFKDSIKVNECELNKTVDSKENNNIVSSKETEKCD